jgi:hypothetical protein
VSSRKIRGISNRASSWGVLFASANSSRCNTINESTHPLPLGTGFEQGLVQNAKFGLINKSE